LAARSSKPIAGISLAKATAGVGLAPLGSGQTHWPRSLSRIKESKEKLQNKGEKEEEKMEKKRKSSFAISIS
jgi:hypothetical protein